MIRPPPEADQVPQRRRSARHWPLRRRASPARHDGAAVPSPPRRAAARNPGAPRRDPEAVTQDSAAAKPARVTGDPEQTHRARDRPARTSLLVPVTGHTQRQTGIPPNRTHPSMTQRPVQPAGSPDDAHITQIREPQPGTLGNMNWRQNGGYARGFGPRPVTYCEAPRGCRAESRRGIPTPRLRPWPAAGSTARPALAEPAEDPGSHPQADQRHSRSTIWRLGARFLPTG